MRVPTFWLERDKEKEDESLQRKTIGKFRNRATLKLLKLFEKLQSWFFKLLRTPFLESTDFFQSLIKTKNYTCIKSYEQKENFSQITIKIQGLFKEKHIVRIKKIPTYNPNILTQCEEKRKDSFLPHTLCDCTFFKSRVSFLPTCSREF